MGARDHKSMAVCGGVYIHEGDRALVFIDDRRRQVARNDLAEDAILLAHCGQS
jgi:hypothetical protein